MIDPKSRFNSHYTSSDEADNHQAELEEKIQDYADRKGISFEEAEQIYAEDN